MLEYNLNDTISAISTAQGQGGIGIVRLSGPQAILIASRIFAGPRKEKAGDFKSYAMHYGHIVDKEKIIDEVILSVMRKPRSYTRQDVVEINCHGGLVALTEVLDLTLKQGARLAEPGEFTKRAFLNGRIDLAQAEAVIDVICAKTDSALKVSLGQLSGRLSKEINKIRAKLINILVILEASIDFPEEGIDQDGSALADNINSVALEINKLLDNAPVGRILREGILAVICGKPNVGKSSLLNALLKKERSIVTPLAGTTRDTIEELIDIRGIPVRITDTAGILKPRDLIEKEAVKRSRDYIKSADLVIIIFDANKKLDKEDKKLIGEIKNKNAIAVINKIDLKNRIEEDQVSEVFPKVIRLCAKTGKNIDTLEDALYEVVLKGKPQAAESAIVSNLRHIQGLKNARKLIIEAQRSFERKIPPELTAQNLKEACSFLDKILGKSFSEDLLDRIFADFCIGK